MTALQAMIFAFCLFYFFLREVSALKEKKNNGSQSMLMDQTPSPNLTKKSILSRTLSVWKCQAEEETPTNFQLISHSDALVFKTLWQRFNIRKDKTAFGGKKNDNTCSCQAHSLREANRLRRCILSFPSTFPWSPSLLRGAST